MVRLTVSMALIETSHLIGTNDRSDLSEEQRQEYVAAVKCLMKLPPKSDKTRFPGAMSRFDDFVAYHMTHAMELHSNYYLFGAHKYYVYLYEQALREECGYTGYQPVRTFRLNPKPDRFVPTDRQTVHEL